MRAIRVAVAGTLALVLVACGGGGGGGSAPAPTYTVSGSITGLLPGNSVVLVDNGASATTFTANGSHSYTGAIATGTAYAITVHTQPLNETCTVANGSGTISSANVVNVIVSCTGNPYTVSGAVTGLTGGSVVLQDNGGNNTTVSMGGSLNFTFTVPVASGSTYAVTVKTQPTGLTCTITNGSGTIAGADVTNVAVSCATAVYNVSVTLSGLPYGATIILQDNLADNLTLTTNGTANFSTPITYGNTYSVSILTQPALQTCSFTGGSGTISAPVNVAVDCPHFGYVTNLDDGTLSLYQVDNASGALVASGSPFGTLASPYSVTTTPDLAFAYVTSFGAGGINAYTLDPTTGVLTANGTDAAGILSYGLAFDTKASFAFLPNFNAGNVSVFAVAPVSGALTEIAGSPYVAGTNPDAVAVTPDGKYVYVTSGLGGTLYGYAIAVNGTLMPVPNSPITLSGASALAGLAIDPSGKYLYVGGTGTSKVYGFSIADTDGNLTAISGSPFTAAANPSSVTIHPNGKFVYVANYGGNNVSGYTIAPSTGVLTPMTGSPFGTGINPESLTIGPTGQYAYVVNSRHGVSPAVAGTVSVFAINPSSGVLSEIAGSPFPAGGNAQTMLIR